jgi:outer membrane protein assembly factor BamB
MPSPRTFLAAACALSLLAGGLHARDWARFRGPNGSGLGHATVPLKWTERDLDWKVKLPAPGHSSPVLWGERIFLTCGDDEAGRLTVLCLHASDGRTLWQREFTARPYRKHARNSLASATPAADGERVYVCWATPKECIVLALDHAGKTAWQADLGPYPSQHGFGVSPIVHDGLVVVHYQPDGDGALVALEAGTGKVRWKLSRKGKNATYSTPCVRKAPGQAAELIFTNWQLGITAVDPLKGEVAWEASVFDTGTQQRAIPSPVVAGDLVLGVCGFMEGGKRLVAVRPADRASGQPAREVWRLEQAVPQMATPLVIGQRVFLCTEQGMATWLHADSGKVIWRNRIGSSFYASPVCVGERIYCVSSGGKVVILAAADRYERLADNTLGEPTQSTPAMAGGRMYFRTHSHLLSLGGRSPGVKNPGL